MLVMPAIDIRDGACVQLVGGSYADERIREPDPLAVARRWQGYGFTCLHIVDLDAATGAGTNASVVSSIIRECDRRVQVGGGLRDTDSVGTMLSHGASAVVVGTRALEDGPWLGAIADRWPGRVIVAADVRDGRPVVRGWSRATGQSLEDTLARVEGLPLAGILVTCVDVEGRLAGPDLRTIDRVRSRTTLPLIASGGIATLEDLRDLRRRDVMAAVVGMALYTGTLDPRSTAEEFGT